MSPIEASSSPPVRHSCTRRLERDRDKGTEGRVAVPY